MDLHQFCEGWADAARVVVWGALSAEGEVGCAGSGDWSGFRYSRLTGCYLVRVHDRLPGGVEVVAQADAEDAEVDIVEQTSSWIRLDVFDAQRRRVETGVRFCVLTAQG